jgi:uncharacterized secreted protein with C-terminal beta-propeller domain
MSTRSLRRLLGAALVLTLPLAAGCTSARGEQKQPTTVAPPMKLVAFDSCDELLADMRRAAKASVGPYGLPGDMQFQRADGALGGARTGAALEAVPASASAFSGTNNHEVGADEPDMVKTDGKRIVVSAGGMLRVVDAATRTETGRLTIGGSVGYRGAGADLFLLGDHALVMLPRPAMLDGTFGDLPGRPGILPPRPYPQAQEMLLVDLAGTPKVISRYVIDGSLVDARMSGGTARIVVRNTPRFATPAGPRGDDEATATAANQKIIDSAPVQAWQPTYEVTTGGKTENGRVGCDRISRPAEFSGTSMLTVLTFDVAAAALGDGDPVSVAADGDTVYGNGSSLYIATDLSWRQNFRAESTTPQQQQTDIHRFDTSGTSRPTYVASGSVPGRLVNQYALSEWEGRLRVATTEEPIGSFGLDATAPTTSSSAIRVLDQRGGSLVEVGKVDGLGKGEQIYSVRFMGPRGYVVTFRQTDPLYSVDLADPTKPTVTGELKITGYSSHLQPAGDGRLIGIGQEADTKGRTEGAQISLFDVADPADPKRLARHEVPGGHSEAEHEPHALLWWPATNLLVVPMTTYDQRASGEPKPTALVLKVTDAGITEVGSITQRGGGPRDVPAPVRRTLVVGDVLWTVSDNGMQASSLSTLSSLGWLPTA